MKKNKNIFIVALVLLVIAIIVLIGKSNKTLNQKDSDFAVKDTATVTKVFLADKNNNSILLEREPDGTWLLDGGLKARKSGIDILLETMVQLATKYPVPKSAHNNIVAQMAAQSVKVEVYQQVYRINLFDKIKLFQHEKLTRTYYVGGSTPDNMGTFMLMEGADVSYVVHLLGFRGYIAPRFSQFEKDWRDHTVFRRRLGDISEVTMEVPAEPFNSFKVANDGQDLILSSLKPEAIITNFDTLRLLNFITSFADLRFESLLDNIDPAVKDSIIHSNPSYILTLVDKNGNTTQMKTFFKPNVASKFDVYGELYVHDLDRAYALVNDEKDFVLIQYYVFDKVLRKLDWFVVNNNYN